MEKKKRGKDKKKAASSGLKIAHLKDNGDLDIHGDVNNTSQIGLVTPQPAGRSTKFDKSRSTKFDKKLQNTESSKAQSTI